MKNLLSISAFSFLMVLCISSISYCQKSDEGYFAPREWRPLSIGIEGGWMRNLQSGSFRSFCSCNKRVEDGKGNSGIGALFISWETSRYFSLGLKFGLDLKSNSSTYASQADIVVIYDQIDSIGHGKYDVTLRTDINSEYLFIAPSLNVTPFGQGFFVEIASEFGNLLNSNITLTRELTNDDKSHHILFGNGKNTEVLQDEPIPDVNKLRIALLFSVGYDFRISRQFSIFPQASYHLPLTTVASGTQSTDWRISSYAFSVGVKYRFE